MAAVLLLLVVVINSYATVNKLVQVKKCCVSVSAALANKLKVKKT